MVTRHRTGWTFLILVLAAALLLTGGLYAVDRLAEKRVADQVADNLQSALGTKDPPQVRFDGFPFLTQVASRHIRQVQVIADGVGTTREDLLPTTLGWALQVAAIALGFVVPVMFFLGAVFALLWGTAYLLGRKIERERAAAYAGYDPGAGETSSGTA